MFLQIGKGHSKNEIGFRLMAKEANTTVSTIYDPTQTYELIWVPVGYYPSFYYQTAKRILYGPHNFVFPTPQWTSNEKFEKSIYTCLSQYNKEIYSQFGKFCMPVEPIPFPVDVTLFCPKGLKENSDLQCFIYFKGRQRGLLSVIENALEEKNITYKTIIYGKYKEEEYIELLNQVQFGIWIGSHESQGFALEESLSMNVPLLVFDVKSLNDEINGEGNRSYMEYSHYNLYATSCPYWDKRCGIRFTHISEFEESLETMKSTYSTFRPRQYILETLSPKVCYERLLQYYT